MRTALALTFLVFASTGAGMAQDSSSGSSYLQVLVEVDSETGSTIAVKADGDYWFDPIPVLTLEHIREASVEEHGINGVGYAVSLHLMATGREALNRNWDRLDGRRVGVMIRGQLVSDPIRLTRGSAKIAFPPSVRSLSEAMELADDLNARIARMHRL